MNKTKIVIAVKDNDLRLSLDLLLRDEPYLNVLGTATTPEGTLGLIKAESPALILLDSSICDHQIEDVLKDSNPTSKVILLGNRTTQEQLAHNIGADAFLRIGGAPENLRSIIKELLSRDFETIQVKE